MLDHTPVSNPSVPARCRPADRVRQRLLAKLATLALCASVLAGCGDQRLSETELSFASRNVAVDPSRALVLMPPSAPPIMSVTQRSYDNAVTQTITLATRGAVPGENTIQVAFLTAADLPEAPGVEGRLLPNPSIEDYAIARELEERLPGVAMAVSGAYVQNRYGPFAYAYGRAGRDGCIYAWQKIERGDSLWRPKSGLISVRLRVCEPAATEASLLRLAYGYSINGTLKRSGWNPIGDGPPPAAGLGEAGAPIYPVPQTTAPEAFDTPTPSAQPRPTRRRVAAPERAEPLPDRPLEGYPTVPPPPAP
jgi:hypothetical protein